MKTPELFKEYIWLVNTIHQAGKISLADINEKWLQTDMSLGVEMARSTFNRHRVQSFFSLLSHVLTQHGSNFAPVIKHQRL